MLRNILLVVRPATGGIRTHIKELLRRLDRSEFSISVAAPMQFLDSLEDDLPSYGRFPVEISAKPSSMDFRAAAQIARIAKQGSCLVHAHGIRAGFVAALGKQFSKFPLVTTYHNLPPTGKLSETALSYINSRSQAIIAVSKAIAKTLPVGNIHVIPNGIDLQHFSHTEHSPSRSSLRLSADDFVAGCVARLSPEKGVDLLIRAAKLLPDVQFLVAGEGPERERLTIMSPPNVRLLGYVEDTRIVYSASDVIVIPSRLEGQGIVALEAMASGSAVIATCAGGLTETIEEGKTGLLVEPENPTKIADAINKLQDAELRETLVAEAKLWVAANSNVDDKIRLVEEVYNNFTP